MKQLSLRFISYKKKYLTCVGEDYVHVCVGRGREFVANLFFIKFCSDPKTALKIKSDENGNVLLLSCLVTQNDASYLVFIVLISFLCTFHSSSVRTWFLTLTESLNICGASRGTKI